MRRMPKGPEGQKRPADMNQLAKAIVGIATGEMEDSTRSPERASVGVKGGRARAVKLTSEQRADIARAAAEARWKKG
jgi:hypothetical protein